MLTYAGRACHVLARYADPKVSKVHCEVACVPEGGQMRVRVLDRSSNGTYVNGLRVRKGAAVPLVSGDELSLVHRSHVAGLAAPPPANELFVSYVVQILGEKPKAAAVTRELNARLFDRMVKGKEREERKKSEGAVVKGTEKGGVKEEKDEERKGGVRWDKTVTKAKARREKSLSGSKRARSYTLGDSNEHLAKRRKRGEGGEEAYYHVDETELRMGPTKVVVAVEEHQGGHKLIRLRRPTISDRSYAAAEFKKAELAFRRFVNKDMRYTVTEVQVVLNSRLEERYRARLQELRNETEAEVDLVSPWKDDAAQSRAMEQLVQDLRQYTETTGAEAAGGKRNRADTALLAWHGSSRENIRRICEEGFKVGKQGDDEGWYGRGIYVTQMPCYGEFYIKDVQKQEEEEGEEAELLLSWVTVGRPYPCKDYSHYGKECVERFDSHYALVHKFALCKAAETPTGDELVLFDGRQLLPRYIVRYTRVSNRQAAPGIAKEGKKVEEKKPAAQVEVTTAEPQVEEMEEDAESRLALAMELFNQQAPDVPVETSKGAAGTADERAETDSEAASDTSRCIIC